MKDEQYNEFIQQEIKKSEDLYFADVEENRESTWDRIEEQLKKKKVISLWIYSIAASLILLVGVSFFFGKKLSDKDSEIALLKAEIKVNEAQLVNTKKGNYEVIKIVDTVKIVNEKIVYLPLKSYEKVIVHDTITNLVKVADTVYVNRAELEPKFVRREETKEQINQQITFNKKAQKKKKNRRFVFLFGKPKEESQQAEENTRLITLRTR